MHLTEEPKKTVIENTDIEPNKTESDEDLPF